MVKADADLRAKSAGYPRKMLIDTSERWEMIHLTLDLKVLQSV